MSARGDEHYEPPKVEQIPSGDGPAVTAAGDSPPSDGAIPGPEWQPGEPPDGAGSGS